MSRAERRREARARRRGRAVPDKLDPDNLICTDCLQPIEDDCDVKWKPGVYLRHPWCHARHRGT